MSRLLSRTVVAGNLLGAFYTFGLGTIMALLSVYAAGLGIPIFWIGAVFSLFWAGRIAGAALAGGASDKLGRSLVAQLALITGCLGLLIIGLASGLSVLSAGVLLAGLSIGAVFPVNVAIIAGGIEPELRGATMGFYEMMCAIGFMIASALGGVLAETMSPGTPFVLSAFVSLSCAIALSILLPHKPAPSAR
jgi:MFS family permease